MERRIKRVPEIAPNEEDGRTLQSQTKSTDIGLLLKSYDRTGTFTHVAKEMPDYGDFSNVTDYLSAQLQVKNAERLFSELPAAIRAEFRNNAGEFLAFMDEPKNLDRQVDLGLVEKPPEDKAEEKAEEPPEKPPEKKPESRVQGGE